VEIYCGDASITKSKLALGLGKQLAICFEGCRLINVTGMQHVATCDLSTGNDACASFVLRTGVDRAYWMYVLLMNICE
jgi:hypothetical protein